MPVTKVNATLLSTALSAFLALQYILTALQSFQKVSYLLTKTVLLLRAFHFFNYLHKTRVYYIFIIAYLLYYDKAFSGLKWFHDAHLQKKKLRLRRKSSSHTKHHGKNPRRRPESRFQGCSGNHNTEQQMTQKSGWYCLRKHFTSKR